MTTHKLLILCATGIMIVGLICSIYGEGEVGALAFGWSSGIFSTLAVKNGDTK